MSRMGPHICLDLQGCDPTRLNCLEHVWTYLHQLPDRVNMTRLTQPYTFPYRTCHEIDQGITGFVIIAESHISIHTYPARCYAFVDVFSCKPFNVDKVVRLTKEWFDATSVDTHGGPIMRGAGFHQPSIPIGGRL